MVSIHLTVKAGSSTKVCNSGNEGLGKETVLRLAEHDPERVYLAARDLSKAATARDAILEIAPGARIELLKLDLSSFDSIKEAAHQFNSNTTRLDILINNAGIMATGPGTTTEGYEIQFGVNHLGHALLTKLLLPALSRASGRVVTISSWAHSFAKPPGIEFDTLKSAQLHMGTWTRYGQSKLANVLYSAELSRHFPDVDFVCTHPGNVRTNLQTAAKDHSWWFNIVATITAPFSLQTVQKGALNQLWGATSAAAESGHYYGPVGKEEPGSELARDRKLAQALWEWTQTEMNDIKA